MNWLLLLYNLLAVAVILDAAASTLASWYIFRLRQRFGTYLAMAFTGTAVEAWIAVVTMGLAPPPVRVVGWIVALRIAARVFKTATMVMLALYLLNFRNGHKGEH